MRKTAAKRVLVIAGPNGAGKTTFAIEFLPNEADCPIFVNADLIATGLSPFASSQVAAPAARLMLKQIDEHARRGRSFAFETTLSGRGHARRISRWRKQGYRVKLFFLCLPTPEAAIARVAQRVSEGGHDVPEQVIRRRFDAGCRYFRNIYRDLTDAWAVYDTSRDVPILVAEGSRQMSTSHEGSTRSQRDLDLAAAETAMRRAAHRARQRAEQQRRPAKPRPANITLSVLLTAADTALHRHPSRLQPWSVDAGSKGRRSDEAGTTYVTATIRNPADPDRAWEGLFRVDTGTTDSLVPRPRLQEIGLRPKAHRLYTLADGREITAAITTADIEFMGETVGGTVLFGDADAQPLLGATALASAGIEVDPDTKALHRLPAVRLKRLREPTHGSS